mmetsp:Transcript_11118/g.39323  ORF Transcript_11118/g.39323 Transcript_11118/m.39323 type:complete len:335 (+) Transcript_11118:5072-6076(+)
MRRSAAGRTLSGTASGRRRARAGGAPRRRWVAFRRPAAPAASAHRRAAGATPSRPRRRLRAGAERRTPPCQVQSLWAMPIRPRRAILALPIRCSSRLSAGPWAARRGPPPCRRRPLRRVSAVGSGFSRRHRGLPAEVSGAKEDTRLLHRHRQRLRVWAVVSAAGHMATWLSRFRQRLSAFRQRALRVLECTLLAASEWARRPQVRRVACLCRIPRLGRASVPCRTCRTPRRVQASATSRLRRWAPARDSASSRRRRWAQALECRTLQEDPACQTHPRALACQAPRRVLAQRHPRRLGLALFPKRQELHFRSRKRPARVAVARCQATSSPRRSRR